MNPCWHKPQTEKGKVMTTIRFDKSVDDIEQPKAAPEDWYFFEITEMPEVLPNAKKQSGMTYAEGGGDNLVIKVRLVTDQAEFNGRPFRVFLPFPQEEDKEAYTPIGKLKYDEKMERIAAFAEACSTGTVDGNEITILPGGKVKMYLLRQLDREGKNFTNNIDVFGSGFKRVDEGSAEAAPF